MDKRQQLFDRYARNLELVNESFKNKYSLTYPSYVCPLCDKVFTEEDIASARVTLEHVPPGKLGGKKRLLTCEDCNNRQGSEFESYLIREVTNSVSGVVDATMQLFSDTKPFVRGRLLVSKKEGIHFNCGKTNQAHSYFNSQIEVLQNQGRAIQFRISYRKHPKKVELALLRIAYLIMFEKLGYGYYFSYCGNLIKSHLTSPEKDIFSLIFPSINEDIKEGVYMVKTFNGEKLPSGFLLSISLRAGNKSEFYYVIMPLPEQIHMSRYLSLTKETNKVKFELTALSDIDRIQDERYIFRI